MTRIVLRRIWRVGGRDVNGREKFKLWTKGHHAVPTAPGPRESSLGGRQTLGVELLKEDDAANDERFERSEAFIHRPRESFPEK